MKRHIFFLLALVAVAGAFDASAQFRIAPQFGYVAKGDGAIQLGLNGEFFLKDNISTQPAFNYYLINNTPSGYSYSYWSIDIDGHYYFTEGTTMVYALLGFSYLHAGVEYSGFTFTDNEFGLNVGLGSNFDIGSSVLPFAELKYNSPWEGLVITIGARFGAGKK